MAHAPVACAILLVPMLQEKKTLYVPLDHCCLYPDEAPADLITQYNPANLPLHNHYEIMTQACEVQAATMDVIKK